jgi:hypothetical protein
MFEVSVRRFAFVEVSSERISFRSERPGGLADERVSDSGCVGFAGIPLWPRETAAALAMGRGAE